VFASRSLRDPQQRSKRLRGITTSKFDHAKAGKQARDGNHPAELRIASSSMPPNTELLEPMDLSAETTEDRAEFALCFVLGAAGNRCGFAFGDIGRTAINRAQFPFGEARDK
jgi:hypothetical protein